LLESQGYEAVLEARDRDVYGQSENQDIAVEVAMGGNEREIDHLENALEQDYGRIIVVCRSKQVKAYIQRKANERDLDPENFSVCTFNSMVDMLPS
jgi:ferredoxin-NADP reductase